MNFFSPSIPCTNSLQRVRYDARQMIDTCRHLVADGTRALLDLRPPICAPVAQHGSDAVEIVFIVQRAVFRLHLRYISPVVNRSGPHAANTRSHLMAGIKGGSVRPLAVTRRLDSHRGGNGGVRAGDVGCVFRHGGIIEALVVSRIAHTVGRRRRKKDSGRWRFVFLL